MKVSFTIKKVEEDKVILVDSSHNVVSWPKDKLPPQSIKEGEVVSFYINEKVDSHNIQEQAKAILNEILNIKN